MNSKTLKYVFVVLTLVFVGMKATAQQYPSDFGDDGFSNDSSNSRYGDNYGDNNRYGDNGYTYGNQGYNGQGQDDGFWGGNRRSDFGQPTPSGDPVAYARSVRPLALRYIDNARRKYPFDPFYIGMGALLKGTQFKSNPAECAKADSEEGEAGGVIAYAQPFIGVTFCPSFLGLDQNSAAQVMIHEMAHMMFSLSECSADNIAHKAAMASGVPVFLSGYTEQCARGEEPLIDRIFRKPH